MGTPKALLQLGGRPFLDIICSRMHEAGVQRTVAVIGAHGNQVRDGSCSEDLEWVVNEEYQRGQLSSLWCGLDAVRGEDGALVTLVDHPLVRVETYRDLILEFSKNPKAIVVPVIQGRRGHPIIFAREHFQQFFEAPLDIGARWVIGSGRIPVHEVAVSDSGIRADIDNRDEYDRWIRESEES
jgi:molybdenum cofactor cytidylyltransferase